jgi:Ni/Fe-hydrogenase subunit HybB-like protein
MAISGRTLILEGHAIPLDPRIASAWVVREVRSMSRPLQLWLAGLSAVMAVAAVAALIALPPGWEVFGTTPTFEWGLMIMAYVFFAIMTSGLCLASSLGTVFGIERFRPLEKRHAILAVLSLTSAFGIIALDLHYPIRMVFGAVLSPAPTSPMWWMGVFYGGYLVILLVEVWSMFWDHPVIHQWACTGAACMAILAPATLGAVFAVLAARPFWNDIFTPVYMVASALLLGTSLLGIVFFAVWRFRLAGWERAGRLAIPSIRLLLGIAIVAVALLVTRHMAAGLAGDTRGLREATEALLTGPLAPAFWGIRVVAGLVVPAILILLPRTRTPAGLLATSVLVMVGVASDRILFVSGGEIAPITTGAGNVAAPYAGYVPSLVELAIVAGAAAFIAVIYTLAERYLDLAEADAHVGFAFPWSHPRDHEAGTQAPTAPGPQAAMEPVVATVDLAVQPAALHRSGDA